MIDVGRDLDLFEQQVINITRRAKDYSEILSREGEFTRPFTAPATRKNQLAFQNYGLINSNSDFNPHIGLPAVWTFGSVERFTGQIEMNRVVYKNGKPYLFELTFYGKQRSLATVFNADRLSDIDWSDYDHGLSFASFTLSWDGLLFAGDLLYPLVDSRKNYFSGDPLTNVVGNIHSPQNPILLADHRPAILVTEFLRFIFESYGQELVGDLITATDNEFTDLYILINRFSGQSQVPDVLDTNLVQVNNATSAELTSVNTETVIEFDEVQDANDLFTGGDTYTAAFTGIHTFQAFITTQRTGTPQGGIYKLLWQVNGTTVFENVLNTVTGTDNSVQSFSIFQSQINLDAGDELQLIYRRESITIGFVTFNGRDTEVIQGGLTIQGPLTEYGATVSLNDQMTDDRIVDFVGKLIQSWNMILVPLEGGVNAGANKWELMRQEDYYAQGTLRDWKGLIDIDNIVYDKPKVYKTINLKYRGSTSGAHEAFKAAAGREYGALSLQTGVQFGEPELLIENPCTIIPPALFKVIDGTGAWTGQYTDIIIHKSIDVEGKPIQEPFLLFYFQGKQQTATPYYVQDGAGTGGVADAQLIDDFPAIGSTRDYISTGDTTYSLCYGIEAPLIGDPVVDRNCYYNHWQLKLERQHDPGSRVLTGAKLVLPALEFFNYKLNDEIFVEGQYYYITEIQHDTNGENAVLILETSRKVRPSTKPILTQKGKITFASSPTKIEQSAAGGFPKEGEYYSGILKEQIVPNLIKYTEVISEINQELIDNLRSYEE
jgi:hypothetical protein